ncbi:uncharacterized protein B0T15DRAFT_496865 [Chaetomium strumarium]|uniref:Uncharacterized protein n=1 Tax=Chaetomium strumarium TaxID=1170767 RepID=A0AAJ0GM11_9PEZI|nr:hypothetical protein B0T15DRAFT_496865 [Chaetomium strumarium]
MVDGSRKYLDGENVYDATPPSSPRLRRVVPPVSRKQSDNGEVSAPEPPTQASTVQSASPPRAPEVEPLREEESEEVHMDPAANENSALAPKPAAQRTVSPRKLRLRPGRAAPQARATSSLTFSDENESVQKEPAAKEYTAPASDSTTMDNSRPKRAMTRSGRAAPEARTPSTLDEGNENLQSEPAMNHTAAPAPSEPPVQNSTGVERRPSRWSSWRTPLPRDPYPLRSRGKAKNTDA